MSTTIRPFHPLIPGDGDASGETTIYSYGTLWDRDVSGGNGNGNGDGENGGGEDVVNSNFLNPTHRSPTSSVHYNVSYPTNG